MPQRGTILSELRKYDDPANPGTSPYDVIAPSVNGHSVMVYQGLISEGENLNAYTSEGIWFCDRDATASTITNWPISSNGTAHAGILEIFFTRTDWTFQRVTCYAKSGSANMPVVYVRRRYSFASTPWGPWAEQTYIQTGTWTLEIRGIKPDGTTNGTFSLSPTTGLYYKIGSLYFCYAIISGQMTTAGVGEMGISLPATSISQNFGGQIAYAKGGKEEYMRRARYLQVLPSYFTPRFTNPSNSQVIASDISQLGLNTPFTLQCSFWFAGAN